MSRHIEDRSRSLGCWYASPISRHTQIIGDYNSAVILLIFRKVFCER